MSIRLQSGNSNTNPAYGRADVVVSPPNINSGFTLSSWAVRAAGAGSGIMTTLETAAGRAQLVLSSTNAHSWRFTGGIFGATTTIANGTVAAGVWAHYALVWDGVNLITYLNGVLNTTLAPAGITAGLWSYMGLGGPFAGGVVVDAQLQDAAFFSRPLAGNIMPDLANKRRLTPRGALEGWFPAISGGAGGVLTDWSEKGRNASTTFGTVTPGTLNAPVSWGGPGTLVLPHRYTEVTPQPPIPAGAGVLGINGNRRRLVHLFRRPVRL